MMNCIEQYQQLKLDSAFMRHECAMDRGGTLPICAEGRPPAPGGKNRRPIGTLVTTTSIFPPILSGSRKKVLAGNFWGVGTSGAFLPPFDRRCRLRREEKPAFRFAAGESDER